MSNKNRVVPNRAMSPRARLPNRSSEDEKQQLKNQSGFGEDTLKVNLIEIPLHDQEVTTKETRHVTMQRMESEESSDSMDEESSHEEYSYESVDEEEPYEYHESVGGEAAKVPRSQEITHKVGNKTYCFYNRGDGTLDFEDPRNGHTKVTIEKDINLIGHINFPNAQSLKTPAGDNSQHFWAANDLAGTKGERGKGTSPEKLTWHHHKKVGKMQLINRAVHSKFMHCGGKALWGTS
jgi:DNase/tRNase domain of colicin-like bacteriocin